MAMRFSLVDPENFLNRSYPYLRWIFTKFGFICWASTIVVGLTLAFVNWQSITDNIVDRSLAPANLFVLWLVYPFVKTLHELGHGYAIKKSGGEVHDIGIMFLVLIPVPYVDATMSIGFRDKYDRMLVGAAGIIYFRRHRKTARPDGA